MYTYYSDFVGECNVCVPANLLPWYTVSVLNFVGKIFVFFWWQENLWGINFHGHGGMVGAIIV